MDYDTSSEENIMEQVDETGKIREIQIPNKLLQKFICNCNKLRDPNELGDPCEKCPYRNY
jgi:hypothetical protein